MLSKPLFRLGKSFRPSCFFLSTSIKEKLNTALKEQQQATPLPGLDKSYDPQRYLRINDPKLVADILRQEELELKAKNYRFTMQTFKYPLLLLFIMGFLFHCWFTVPYKVVYRHATLGEKHSLEPKYVHSLIFAPLSVRNTQDFIVYFTVMTHALYLLNRFMRPRQIMLFYLLNGFICDAVAYYVEKQRDPTFKPKCLGGCTSLAFMGTLAAMKPEHLILKQWFLPYQALVAGMVIYELSTRRNERELSKTAHLVAFITGLAFGRFNKALVF